VGRRGTHISYCWRKPGGKRSLRRPRRKWVDNIKMDLGEIGWSGVDWIDLAQDRDQWRALVSAVGEWIILRWILER
jgi:hypothetical protein